MVSEFLSSIYFIMIKSSFQKHENQADGQG